MSAGFVGNDKDGHFVHYCHCGEWGAFGFGYFPREGKLGKWYCREHRPQPPATPPPPTPPPPPKPIPEQGSLF